MPARPLGPPRALVLLPLAALALAAPDARAADVTVASDPVFVAVLTDATTVSGRIRGFQPDGTVTLAPADGPDRALPIGSIVTLTRQRLDPAPAAEASVVLFPDGDRLYRTAIGAADETTLDVQSFSLGHLAVPLDGILGLVLSLPNDSDALDAMIGTLRNEPRTSEVVVLANGDRLTGGFLGLTDRAVDFQQGKTPLKLERTGVVALGFDPAHVAYPRPKGPYYEVTLTDGSRLGASNVRVEQGHLVGDSRFGLPLRVPVAEVARLHARTPHVVYLSEREPLDQTYVAYVGPTRPYRRDTSVEGHPIRMSGEEFARGLGTQSRTLLAFRVEPGDRRFQARVGVDDRAGTLGNVVFRVFVDKTERYASPPMAVRDEPRLIDLDLTGAKLLILITEFGERGDVRDLADWAEARIIR